MPPPSQAQPNRRLHTSLAVDEVSREGHPPRRLRRPQLEREEGVAFLLARQPPGSRCGSLIPDPSPLRIGPDEEAERPAVRGRGWPGSTGDVRR
ncbi:MAG: hypothetical protein FJ083_06400 [Cyanobacteria bacterium K_Offshore_surface_m2_239]|nr:hypothetical protein [Cyanobacteria bacterium K_Offshore_surface_m2_239]